MDVVYGNSPSCYFPAISFLFWSQRNTLGRRDVLVYNDDRLAATNKTLKPHNYSLQLEINLEVSGSKYAIANATTKLHL